MIPERCGVAIHFFDVGMFSGIFILSVISNVLSILFALLLYSYLAIRPQMGNLMENSFGTTLYTIVDFTVIYGLSLMAAYAVDKGVDAEWIIDYNGTEIIVAVECSS